MADMKNKKRKYDKLKRKKACSFQQNFKQNYFLLHILQCDDISVELDVDGEKIYIFIYDMLR